MQEGKVEKLRDEIKQIKTDESRRKKKIEDGQKEIRQLERQCENRPPEEASLEIGERFRELREQINVIKGQIQDLRGQYEVHSQAIDAANDEKNRVAQQYVDHNQAMSGLLLMFVSLRP